MGENGMITEWEPKSVGLGTALLFVIFIAIFLIQRCVDRSYAVQRQELDEAVAKLKADRAESGEQKTMDDDAAWADLKEVVEENAGIAQFFKDLVASQTAAEGDDEGEEQEPSATASAITTLATRLGLAAADSEEEAESKAAESAPASKDDAAKPEALEVELDASS